MSLYMPSKYKKYGRIVSLKSPVRARTSVKTLAKEFSRAKTHDKRLRVWRVANLASNRAFANLKKANLSYKERQEYRQIGGIYRNFADEINKNM